MALQKRGGLYRFARQTFILAAVGMLSLVLFISPSVYALQGVNYKTRAIGENWSIYNENPSGGYNVASFAGRDNALRLGVDASTAVPPGRLEGLRRTTSPSEVVRVGLYIDTAWQAADVQTGFGVKGKNTNDVITADIRVEFIRSNGFTGWRIGNDALGWTNVSAGYDQDAWNELEFAINKDSSQIEVYINGTLISYTNTQTANYLTDVTLANYNFGSLSEDYSSHWDKLEVGRYDSESPTISFLAPAVDDEVMKGSGYVSVFASDEIMLRQVGVTIYNVDGEIVRENAPFLTGTDCRLDVSLAGLSDGWYRIDVHAIDGASNQSQTLSRPFMIDSTAPRIAITSPPEGTLSGVVAIEGNVSDAHPRQYYSVVKNADGGIIAGPEQVISDTVSGWQWDTTTFPDGMYTITLAADDTAGNHSEVTREVRVDNTAPTVTLDSFNTNLTAGEMVIFSGDINDASAQLVLSVDGVHYPVTEIGDGRWRHVFVNGLTAGHHAIGVIATDANGNASSMSSSVREVFVISSIVGVGIAGPLEVKPFIDTAQLFRAVTVPTPGQASTVTKGETDILDTQALSKTSTGETESPSVALEPTENGWKLLGILWYWWALSLLLAIGIGWFVVTKWRRRSSMEVLTD